MATTIDKLREEMTFYEFWSRQYVARNELFRSAVAQLSRAKSTLLDEYGLTDFPAIVQIPSEAKSRVNVYLFYGFMSGGAELVMEYDDAIFLKELSEVASGLLISFGYPWSISESMSTHDSLIKIASDLTLPAGGIPRRLIGKRAVEPRQSIAPTPEGRGLMGELETTYKINFDAPQEAINAEIMLLKKEWDYHKNRNGLTVQQYETALWEVQKKHVKKILGASFKATPTQNRQRALGLWLYDYCQQQQVKIEKARNCLERLIAIEDKEQDPKIWSSILERTRACISEAEVLPIRSS